MNLTANIIDLHRRRIYHGKIRVENGHIKSIEEAPGESTEYILPGFVDAHVHIESAMLVPSEFARLAVVHGTVGTVSDPHEIANVMGVEGVEFMLENGAKMPFKFCFGAPSCVPATTFETAGATIGSEAVEKLLADPRIYYLSEMMNYPGVIFEDLEVMKKLAAARHIGKPIDGHAPGVRGDDARKYFGANITTDHECFTYEEGLEKAKLGVKILIREGSAAKNFAALIPLLNEFPNQIMFCSDDKHPDDLMVGHINQLVARAIAEGYDFFDTLRAACLHPVEHYGLPIGTLKTGDPADFILTDDLENFSIKQTYINGKLAAENGRSLIPRINCEPINRFNISAKKTPEFAVPIFAGKSKKMRVIQAHDGQLVTSHILAEPKIKNGYVVADEERDILKFAVVNRYMEAPSAVAFIQNFGIKNGAIASCVGHDSHNILAVGTSDEMLCRAVNLIIENKGGISAISEKNEQSLPLPVAGIMTTEDGHTVGKKYAEIDAFVKRELGSPLHAPFMTLSFMALLVIPELKLSDLGLFDGKRFEFVGIWA